MADARRRADEEVTLLDYARVIWRYKWLVIGVWVVTVAGTWVWTINAPKIYEATTTVMSPREGGGAGLLLGGLAASGLAQQLPGVVVPSLTPNRDMLISLLKSRTMGEEIIRRFGLQERYQDRYFDQALKHLEGLTNVFVSKEGVISIRVQDTSPQLAAQIANFYMENLERLVSKFSIGDAGRKRRFIADQLARAKKELADNEQVLRAFQERNRAFVLQEQTRGAIDAAARLKGEIIAVDAQLEVMRAFATEANPEVIALRRRVEEMKRQLAQIQFGDGLAAASRGSDQRDFAVPFSRVPAVGLELARLTRDLKTQETVVTLLTGQLEQARIDEAKDIPVVQVLDPAVVPEHHSKPRLRDNLLIAGAVSLFLSLVLVFAIEYVHGLHTHQVAA